MMNGVVALASSALETFAIGNDEVAATVPDQSLLLKCLCQQRDSSPAYAQHLGESFLRHPQLVAADAIGTLQQAAREPRNAIVYGVAGCDLLSLRQEHLAVAREQIADGRIAINKHCEAASADDRETPADLRYGAGKGEPRAKSTLQADGALTAHHCRLEGIPSRSQDQKRNEAGLREVDGIEWRAGLKYHRPLRDRNLFQVPIEVRERFRGQSRKQAVAPVVMADWVGQNNLLTAQRAAYLPGRIDRCFRFWLFRCPCSYENDLVSGKLMLSRSNTWRILKTGKELNSLLSQRSTPSLRLLFQERLRYRGTSVGQFEMWRG